MFKATAPETKRFLYPNPPKKKGKLPPAPRISKNGIMSNGSESRMKKEDNKSKKEDEEEDKQDE